MLSNEVMMVILKNQDKLKILYDNEEDLPFKTFEKKEIYTIDSWDKSPEELEKYINISLINQEIYTMTPEQKIEYIDNIFMRLENNIFISDYEMMMYNELMKNTDDATQLEIPADLD